MVGLGVYNESAPKQDEAPVPELTPSHAPKDPIQLGARDVNDHTQSFQQMDKGYKPDSMTSLGAAIEHSWFSGPTSDLWYMAKAKMARGDDGGDLLSVDELKSKFPGPEWKSQIGENEAKVLYERHRNLEESQRLMDQGPQGMGQSTANWIAEQATTVVDPVNLALFSGVGLGIKTAGAFASAASPYLAGEASRLVSLAPKLLTKTAAVYAENFAGIATSEFTVGREARAAFQEDFSPTEALKSAAEGAVMGTAIHGFFSGLGKLLGENNTRFPKQTEIELNRANDAIKEGKVINNEPIRQARDLETMGATPDPLTLKKEFKEDSIARVSRPEFKELPIHIESPEIKTIEPDRVLYATQGQLDMVSADHFGIEGQNTGKGLYMGDEPLVRNGLAASRFRDDIDGIFSVTTKDLKLLDLDSKPSPEVLSEISSQMKANPEINESLGGKIDEAIQDKSIAEIYSIIEDKNRVASDFHPIHDEINKKLSEKYDGFTSVRSDEVGGSSNNVTLFPGKMEKLNLLESHTAEADLVPTPEKNTILSDLKSKDNYKDINYSPETEQKVNELKQMKEEPESDLSQLKEADKKVLEEAQYILDQKDSSPTFKEAMQEIADEERKNKSYLQMFSEAILCIREKGRG